MLKDSDALTSAPTTTSTFQANGSRLLTPADFIKAVRQGTITDWNGFQISGDVDLLGETIAKPLAIHGATFTGTVNLSQARFERGVDFSGCRFQKLILSDARVEGPLTLDSVVIGAETTKVVPDVELLRQIVARLKAAYRLNGPESTDPTDEKTRKRQARVSLWEKRFTEAKSMHGDPKTVADFDNVHVAGSLSMFKARVFGSLSCNNAEIEDEISINGAQIYGDITLRHTSLGELHTDRKKLSATVDAGAKDDPCRVQGKLDLTSATVSGDVRLIGIVIGGPLTMEAANIDGSLLCRPSTDWRARLRNGAWLLTICVKGWIDFSGARVNGELNLENSNIGASLTCTHSVRWDFRIKGGVMAQNARVGADMFFLVCRLGGDVRLINAKIGNTLAFNGSHLAGNLFLQNTSIGSDLLITSVTDEEKRIRCEITKKAWLLGVTVTGNVDLSGAHIGDDLIMQNANVGQNLLARVASGFQTEIDGNTRLNGARVRGAVELGGPVLRGELDLDSASVDGGFSATFDLDESNDWKVVNAHVDGRIHANAATIRTRVMLMGLTVSPIVGGIGNASVKERGVDFTGAQINGEFSLYSDDFIQEILQFKKDQFEAKEISPEKEREVVQLARQARTVIEGDLRLTRSEVSGDISLGAVNVQGELDLRDADVRANIICKPIKFDPQQPPLRASVHRADLETLDMTGDINLTGLSIGGELVSRSDCDLTLVDARIRGRLELCPRADQRRLLMDNRAYDDVITHIRGDLRLDAADISHVIISGKNLDDVQIVDPQKPTRIRVGLERATIGRLQIVQPLPGTLDLSNLKVNRLDRLEDSSMYKDMLENSYPFRKSNYLVIEHALRNAGYETQADQVHVLMRRRDRPPVKRFLPWLLDRFLDLTIKYGTTSKRLIFVMVVWFFISLFIFSNVNRVEVESSNGDSRPPKTWNWGEAALFTSGLHIPIISLGVEQKAQPKETHWKAYAATVVALSWVMWPLLIASASGLIRKRE